MNAQAKVNGILRGGKVINNQFVTYIGTSKMIFQLNQVKALEYTVLCNKCHNEKYKNNPCIGCMRG